MVASESEYRSVRLSNSRAPGSSARYDMGGLAAPRTKCLNLPRAMQRIWGVRFCVVKQWCPFGAVTWANRLKVNAALFTGVGAVRMSVMDLEVVVSEFASAVVAQQKAIEEGDARASNRAAKRYVRSFSILVSHGDRGRSLLKALFDHEEPYVRVMAASYLLRYAEQDSLRILEAEANAAGMVGFGAQQALARWRDGTWALDLDV